MKTNTKVIAGFSSYEMDANGKIFNVSTKKEITAQQEKEDGVYSRLTSDEGKRVWINKNETHKNLFQPDLTGKTKKSAKPKADKPISKSQAIYILYKKEGLTINEIADKGFKKGLVRSAVRAFQKKESLRVAADRFFYNKETGKFEPKK